MKRKAGLFFLLVISLVAALFLGEIVIRSFYPQAYGSFFNYSSEKWQDGDSALALPKVAHRKSHAGRKTKEAPAKEAAPEVAVEAATEETPKTEEKES